MLVHAIIYSFERLIAMLSSSKSTYCFALIVLCRCAHCPGILEDIVHRRSQCGAAGGQCTEHLENMAYLHTWMSRLVL